MLLRDYRPCVDLHMHMSHMCRIASLVASNLQKPNMQAPPQLLTAVLLLLSDYRASKMR